MSSAVLVTLIHATATTVVPFAATFTAMTGWMAGCAEVPLATVNGDDQLRPPSLDSVYRTRCCWSVYTMWSRLPKATTLFPVGVVQAELARVGELRVRLASRRDDNQ